ncbi:flagellar filament capping protein FliD [Clostridium gasigenes]|uniref:flagellar filament capping protein FliD n=1 Tax=Clostridium gasigenes TaxID=94869 RepID=UPI001C0AF5E9|nr:flagellar filament capping protein FliD [Clostridium gasigenes]MBU3109063.1 flagellar filament capping protein FliD [Clostridium gasigenes]
MRITGLGSGLDMDKIVKDSMKPYRIKVDQIQQKRDIVEMKQQLYRDVIKDSRDFNDKYFTTAKADSLLLARNWATTKFESSDSAAVSVTGLAGGKSENYKVTVDALATSSKATLNITDLNGVRDTINVVYNGKTVDIDINGLTSEKDIANKLNTELSSLGMKAAYSSFSNGIVIETMETGTKIGASANTFVMTVGAGTTVSNQVNGKDLEATIVGANGTIVYDATNILGKNKVVIDDVEFSFNDLTTTDVRITGKTDTKATVDKIVSFVNDYNVLMEKLNTMTSEKRNKNYMPLTEEQKKEMSESEVKLWNEKTKQGQLNRDSDVTRIVSKMKETMTSVMGASIDLKSIGIDFVKDYGTKNGTFTVDVDKLTKSLENNSEEVMKFFIATPPDGTPENEKSIKTGIFQKLKTVLYEETGSVSSRLIKKAGIDGSSINELTKNIEEYNKKMAYMEKDFARREQNLYSKYAKLEVTMNKYNAQQTSMVQQMGGN